MSEHITHIAVYDDAARLIGYSERFSEAFKESIKKQYDCGWITSGSNGNHLWALPLLEECRKKWKAGLRDKETLQKIAAAIGWITHRAADLIQKPLEAILEAEGNLEFNGQELSAYFDTIAFREIFKSGTYSPNYLQPISGATLEHGMASHPAASALDVTSLENSFSHFLLGELLNNQEFAAEEKDLDKWFDQFMGTKQKFSEDLDMYINGFKSPESGKTKKYIINFKYFDPNDSLIRLVQSIKNGKPDVSIKPDVAVAAAANQSQYSRMVANAYTMLLFANDFFAEKISKSELYEVLNMEHQFRN
jgi:hypothetical protein